MKKRRTTARPISPDAVTSFEPLHDPQTRDQSLLAIGQWVVDTCLVFGCRPELAYQVASLFVGGLRKDLEVPE